MFSAKKPPHHLNATGLAGLELLVVLAIICLVGGIGSYLFIAHRRQSIAQDSPKNSKSSTTDAGQSTSPGGIPASATSRTSASSAATNTGDGKQINFPITEAGLQISLPAALADLTYYVVNSGGQKTITFSTKSLSKSVPACSATRGHGAFDTVIRAAGRYQPPANSADGGLIHQYDDYYVAYRLPVGPCAQNLTTSQQHLLDDQSQSFYGSLNTVRPL